MRFFPLAVLLTILGAAGGASSCGPAKEKCSMSNCTGCCDMSGTCQPGSLPAACGSGGANCQACLQTYSCDFGFCRPPSMSGGGSGGGTGGANGGGTGGANGGGTGGANGGGTGGGGTGGGTGGGGTSCSPSNCTGCCDVTGCQIGTTSAACGSSGNACQLCTSQESCRFGGCVMNTTGGGAGGGTGGGAGGGTGGGAGGGGATCSPVNCGGCCMGNVCQPGTINAACGAAGQVCTMCMGSQMCMSSQCVSTTCSPVTCAGCCQNNICQVGDTNSACGAGGATCAVCNIPQSCSLGVCSGGGTPTSFGNSGNFTGSSNHGEDFLLGYAINIPTTVTLTHFGVNIDTPVPSGARGRFALYSNSASAPSTLLASTPSTLLVAGRQEIPTANTVQLSPGTYWLMGLYSVSTPVRHSANAVSIQYRALSFSLPLPTTFGPTMTYTGTEINAWLVGL